MADDKKVEAVVSSAAARAAERLAAQDRARELRAAEMRAAETEREAEPVAAAQEPSPAFRPYRVQLDPQTSRIFTEVIDPRTGSVLLRIPPGYQPPPELEEREPERKREVEL